MYSVETVKNSMRISHNKLDDQISSDILACLSDLQMCGVATYRMDPQGEKIAVDDPLIDKAVELYCKAQADYQGAANRYLRAYESLKGTMQMCEDYRA
jgi:hypothetical protein